MFRIFSAFLQERQKKSSFFDGGNANKRDNELNCKIAKGWKPPSLIRPLAGMEVPGAFPSGKGGRNPKVNPQDPVDPVKEQLREFNMAPSRGLPHAWV
jgi:hypothetical protein